MADTLNDKLAQYGIDYMDAMERMDDDADLYKMLALKYLTNQAYNDLVAALEVKEFDDAYKAAHTLKGVAGNLSFATLFKAAAAMSEALYEGEYQAAEKILPDVTSANEKVMQGLEAWENGEL